VAVHVVPFQSSALAMGFVPFDDPPATTTWPLPSTVVDSNVALWKSRPEVIVPPEGQVAAVPEAGIVNTSVDDSGVPPLVRPPVIRTLPFASRVAVIPSRAAGSTVVVDHADVDVLNNCALVVLVVPPVLPPAIRTMLLKFVLLLVSSVAVWDRRATAMLVETAVHEPDPLLGL
jgi:hypothetical protein